MTAAGEHWSYVVEPPDDGWVWLPGADEDIAAWAQAVCDDLGALGATGVRLGEQLRSFALPFRQREHDLGGLWIPDSAYGVLASLTADRVRVDVAPGERFVSESVCQERGLASPEVTQVELPAGPALRVRRVERAGSGPAGDQIVESVKHLVTPAGIVDSEGYPTGVELVLTWSLLHEGDDFAQLADETAQLLRIVRP